MGVLTSNTHVFKSEAEICDYFLNFQTRANVLTYYYYVALKHEIYSDSRKYSSIAPGPLLFTVQKGKVASQSLRRIF